LGLLSDKGVLGFITPATFTNQYYFKKIRQIFSNYSLFAISKYFFEVFDDAEIGDSVTWIISKEENKFENVKVQLCKTKTDAFKEPNSLEYKNIVQLDGQYYLSINKLDFNKIYKNTLLLENTLNIIVGIKPYQVGKGYPTQNREIVTNKIYTSNVKIDETYVQCVIGKDFHRYKFIQVPSMFLSYGKWLAEPRESAPFFDDEKIIIRQTADSIIANIDSNSWVNLNNVYNIGIKNKNYRLKYFLSILNSRLIKFLYQEISQEEGRLFAEVKKVNLLKLPIKDISLSEQQPFINKADLMLSLNKDFQSQTQKLSIYICSQYQLEKLSGKLSTWYELDFSDFIKELNKAIKAVKGTPLSKKDEFEWMELFEENKQKALALKAEIDRTDKKIDQMVYELYGLTEEEIGIVEGN